MKQSVLTVRTFFKSFSVAVLSITLLFASCSKNKDKAEGAEFVGQYAVEDGDDDYTLTIESKGGNKYQIQNFGGFMYVPVEATVTGGQLKIPAQTFKNGSGFSITITGTGTLGKKTASNDLLVINYSVSGDAEYDSEIEGLRK